MSDSIFGEIVETADVKAAVRPVEVRYSLIGERVRTALNIAYMANAYAEKNGIKPMKVNLLFQVIVDQAIDGYFEPTQTVYITLSNGKPWRLSFEGMSRDEFNERVDAFRAKQEGSEPSKGAHAQVQQEGDAHKQAELLAGEGGQNPSGSEESQEEEEDELTRLEREMAQ